MKRLMSGIRANSPRESFKTMAKIFGSVEKSVVKNGKMMTVFRIPAFSKTLVKQRGKANSKVKGLDNYEVRNVETVGRGDIPGQKVFDVTVVSDR